MPSQDRMDVPTGNLAAAVEAPAPSQARKPLHADLQPLTNKADLAFQRAELAVLTYAQAPHGSPRRELFERMELGESVEGASAALRERSGLVVPAEDREYLKEYQAKRGLQVPKIELDQPVFAHVSNRHVERAAGVIATSNDGERAARAFQQDMSADQLGAIEEFKGSVNFELGKASENLSKIEAEGGRNTPAWEQAMKEYTRLQNTAAPTPAALTMARAREDAQTRLEQLEADPAKAATISAALRSHYERVASGGGAPGTPGGLGTGIPKPTVNGRFAGMEDPRDLALTQEAQAQRALLAHPGAPNADRLVASLRQKPADLGIDNAALQGMWEDRQARAAAHAAWGRELAPKDGTLGKLEVTPEMLVDHAKNDPGVVDPGTPGFTSRPKGIAPELPRGEKPMAGGPVYGDGPTHGGQGPGGPGGPGDGPTQGGQGGPTDGLSRPQRMATVSPETHSASVLEKQIQAIEAQARARIRRQNLMTAATIAGSTLLVTAEVAIEVGSAPMNPNADPAKALLGIGQGVNTATRELMANQRQLVHERTKADTDIRHVVETHTKQQEQHASEWAEKMSNQMEHLEAIKPGVAGLDAAEIAAARKVVADPTFLDTMTQARDRWAFETHLAAAHEMAGTNHEGMKAQGLAVARFLEDNRADLDGEPWEEISKALEDQKGKLVNVAEPGQRRPMYADLDAGGAYQAVLAELDSQHRAQMIQEEASKRLVSAAGDGTLHRLVGDANASRLSGAGAVEMESALRQKHGVERSIEASWRDFVARAPLHADATVRGGMDPNRLLAELYGRKEPSATGANSPSPEKQASDDLQKHFREEARDPVASREQGIPRGWGDPTVMGSDKVGLAASPNGGTQALLIGYARQGEGKDASFRATEASIHLFAREAVNPVTKQTPDLSPGQRAVFEDLRKEAAQPPHVVVLVDGKDYPTGTSLKESYNGAVAKAYQENAQAQLAQDAKLYAEVRTGQGPETSAFKQAERTFLETNAAAYGAHGSTLARRESLSGASAETMAAQMKVSATFSGFHATTESGRGHFGYASGPSALDISPRKALEGKGGDGVGRDFRRAMSGASQVYQAMPDEIRKARDAGNTALRGGAANPAFLRSLSPTTGLAAANLNDSVRQSQSARLGHVRAASTPPGTDGPNGRYAAAQAFLERQRAGAAKEEAA